MNKQLNIYTIRDTKSGAYNVPQSFRTHGEAERFLSDQVNLNQDSLIHRHPEDFDLFHLGSYDTDTGLITALETPTHIVKALHLKAETKE